MLLSFGIHAEIQDQAYDLIIIPEFFQDFDPGGIAPLSSFFRYGRLQFVKQDDSELLRRIDVEFLASQRVDLRRELADLFADDRAGVYQLFSVHGKAAVFHSEASASISGSSTS